MEVGGVNGNGDWLFGSIKGSHAYKSVYVQNLRNWRTIRLQIAQK